VVILFSFFLVKIGFAFPGSPDLSRRAVDDPISRFPDAPILPPPRHFHFLLQTKPLSNSALARPLRGPWAAQARPLRRPNPRPSLSTSQPSADVSQPRNTNTRRKGRVADLYKASNSIASDVRTDNEYSTYPYCLQQKSLCPHVAGMSAFRRHTVLLYRTYQCRDFGYFLTSRF
jgi:hypothetical protein